MPRDGTATLIDTAQKLKRFLPDYLEEHWFSKGHEHPKDEEGKFHCFFHKEDTPSMKFVKGSGRQAVICYGCKNKGDLFRVAHHFEGLPLEGKEWVHQTLLTLSRRYGVDMGSIEVSSEELRKIRLRQLANHAMELLQELGTPALAIERGLSEEMARSWGVLTVPDLREFHERLRAVGAYDDRMLEDLGYLQVWADGEVRSKVFGPRILSIPLRSPSGHVVSFTGRNLDWKKGEKFPKYRDVKNSEVYQKGTILYGFDRALKSRQSFVYVFEGYFDVILAHQAGIENAVACCGTELTAAQIRLLQEASIHHVCLCFDRDPNDAGWAAMDKFIETTFQGIDSLRVEILELPEGFHDPDDFLKEKGGEAFRALPRQSAFRWRMERRAASGAPVNSDFANAMVQLIAMEPSPIYRADMQRELSEFSSRPIQEISDSVRVILDRKEQGFMSAVETLKTQTFQKIKNAHGQTALEEIRASAGAADQLEKTYLEGEVDTIGATIELVDRTVLCEEKDRPKLVHKTGIPQFDEVWDGIPSQDVMIGVMGQPSAGKSSILTWLIPILIRHPENKQLSILLHSTDDGKAFVIRKLVSTISGVREAKIRRATLSPDEKERVRVAATILKEWLGDRRLEIRDASDGFEVPYAERWIKQFRDRHPEREVVYILDNFYKTWVDAGEQVRQKVDAQSNRLQLLSQQEKMTVIKTIEPRKSGSPRLTLDDIKETKHIEHNCHATWIIHNGIPRAGRSAFVTEQKTWKGPGGERPMVELQVAKWKDAPKGSLFFQFDYDSYFFRATEFVSELEMIKRARERREREDEGAEDFGGDHGWRGRQEGGRSGRLHAPRQNPRYNMPEEEESLGVE